MIDPCLSDLQEVQSIKYNVLKENPSYCPSPMSNVHWIIMSRQIKMSGKKELDINSPSLSAEFPISLLCSGGQCGRYWCLYYIGRVIDFVRSKASSRGHFLLLLSSRSKMSSTALQYLIWRVMKKIRSFLKLDYYHQYLISDVFINVGQGFWTFPRSLKKTIIS